MGTSSLPSPHPTSVIGLSLQSLEISVSPTLWVSVSSLTYRHLGIYSELCSTFGPRSDQDCFK